MLAISALRIPGIGPQSPVALRAPSNANYRRPQAALDFRRLCGKRDVLSLEPGPMPLRYPFHFVCNDNPFAIDLLESVDIPRSAKVGFIVAANGVHRAIHRL